MGKKLTMKFDVGDSSHLQYEWYSGQILHYDPMTGKYGGDFPSDKQTVFIDPVEEAEDIEFLEEYIAPPMDNLVYNHALSFNL